MNARRKFTCLVTPILIMLLLFSFALGAFAGSCEDAFQRCYRDAGLYGGSFAWVVYMAYCGSGYAWCVKYFD